MPHNRNPWLIRVWGVACLCLGGFIWMAAIIPNGVLTEFLRVAQIAVAVAVLVAYARDGWAALQKHRPDNTEQLVLGICTGFVAVLGAGIWSLLWRLAGQPAWMYNSDTNAFLVFLVVLAGVLHVTAPGAIADSIPPRRWVFWGILTGLTVLVCGIILLIHPDTKPIVDWLEPWLGERPYPHPAL